MRILVVNDVLEPTSSSVVRLVREQARGLARLGNEVVLLGTVRERAAAGETTERLPSGESWRELRLSTNFPPRFRSWFGSYNPQILPAFRQVLAELRPDVVHFHNVHSSISFAAVAVARRFAPKIFLTAHDVMLFWPGKLLPYDRHTTLEQIRQGEISYRRGLLDRLGNQRLRWMPGREAWIRRCLDRAGATLLAVSDVLGQALGQYGYRSITMRNPVDPDHFRVTSEVRNEFLRRHLGGRADRETSVLLFGGRLSRAKGGEQVLKAMALLGTSAPELLVFGGGSPGYERAFLERAHALGLSDRVHRTGWLTGQSLAAAYAAADWAVNPSLCFETLSMFNLEAAAAGRPVLSTFFGGASETIELGASREPGASRETGILFNPYDEEALAAGLDGLSTDRPKASAMGQRGRERILREFSPDQHLERMVSLYEA